MILIHCPSAGCYWANDVGATVEQASASFVTHWRSKHEPIGQTPLDPGASPDRLPIAQGPPAPPAKIRPSVTVIRRDHTRRDESAWNGEYPSSTVTDREEYLNRPDPDKAALKRKARKMGRPL